MKKQKGMRQFHKEKVKGETDMHFDPFSFAADVPSVLSLVNHIRCCFLRPFKEPPLSLFSFSLCVYVYEICPCPVFSASSLLLLVPVPALSVRPFLRCYCYRCYNLSLINNNEPLIRIAFPRPFLSGPSPSSLISPRCCSLALSHTH